MHLGGAGLAAGYRGRAELTAERFIEHAEYGRLYRTGDLCRWQSDGTLVFVGRADQQVKLRGFRIEPGEIEAALRRLPGVTDAAVRLHGEGERRRLIGYVARSGVASAGEDAAELRQELRRLLPEAMVPSQLIAIPSLPLTANGKLDRAALPSPEELTDEAFVPPHAGIEEKLALIWSAVLQRDRAGRHDNFFALGGDSILSIQITARCKQHGLSVAVADLFRYQTIAELAPHVAGAIEVPQPAPAQAGELVSLTPVQRWFFARNLPDPEHFNLSVMLHLRRPLSFAVVDSALQAVSQQHAALRLRFVNTADGWRQSYAAADVPLPLHEEDLRNLPAEKQRGELAIRASHWQRSLDLTTGPTMRVVLFWLSDGQRLLWCVHHLCVDMVAWRILLEDLELAATAAANGEVPQLSRPTAPFSAWPHYLETIAAGPELRAEANYWSRLPDPPRLPMDFAPRAPPRLASSKHASFCLDAAETRSLLEEAPAAYRTRINELLLTALTIALAEWTGARRLVVEMEGHGRVERVGAPDVSRTVGWFTSIYPVEISLPDGNRLDLFIKAVKEQLRAVPSDGLGYGLLRYLVPEALPLRPQSPIVFNYLGQFAAAPETGLFAFATESAGENRSPQGHRTHPINIDALVQNGHLTVAVGFSTEEFRPETVERLADGFRRVLVRVIAHCCDPNTVGYTPSDFPLARPTQAGLDDLAARYGRAVEGLYPLTAMQHGMLFHTLFAETGDPYFEQLHLRLDGLADPERFQTAWLALIAHHAVLRTTFLLDCDPPLQVVLKEAAAAWRVADWRDLSEAQQHQALDRLLAAERARGFEFGNEPPIRFHLSWVGENSADFVWCFHHALLDGWSLPLLLADLAALHRNPTTALPPRPLFKDYVAWYLRQDHQQAETYWRAYLDGFDSPTPLPAARAAFTGDETHAELRFALDARETAEILRFAAAQGLTVATVLQAAWALLLHRYSDETDIVFGVTVSGRDINLVGSDNIVGLLINTIPLRVRIDATPLGDWLRRLQAEQIESRRWAFMPLAEIHACSDLPGGTRPFDNILVFENYPAHAASETTRESDPLRLSEVTPVDRTSYPLTIIAAVDGQLRFRMGYDGRSFAPKTINGLFDTLRAALEAIVRSPAATAVRSLAPLAPGEAARIRRWSLARNSGLPIATLVDLFAEQVRCNPCRVAVNDDRRQLTYAELDAATRRLAQRLRSLEGVCDRVVGLFLERTSDIVVGILSILRSGAAYLPLDPTLPAERLRFMLRDAQAVALVTEQSLRPLAAAFGVPFLCIDIAEAGTAATADGAGPKPDPSSLAYVMYTSGSTGQPKGVMVTHANVARLFAATDSSFGFSSEDVWTLFHNVAFDFSVWEIWGALLYGGRLVVVPQVISRDPYQFHALLEREGVTVLNQTPSAFRHLIPVCETVGACLSLRLVIFGGEALDLPSLRPWFALYGDARPQLVNMYGITETTVHVTERPLSVADTGSIASLIGRPLADLDVFLLDREGHPVPIGAIGELNVGGPGLARGYLNRPQLTAERFVEIEVYDELRRLYRSGDLGRWRNDGSLEFLGRADHQVKLRGFRIELGEIEAALADHPGVREAVVLVQGSDARRSLVAYVVGSGGESVSQKALREWLAARLPPYMVPTRFITLDRLPLTRNGKVDRRALPDVDSRENSSSVGGTMPRNSIERALADIWADALGVATIGIDDDFFALGGQSLLAMRLATRIHHELCVRIPVRWIFEHPTIAALAPLVTAREREAQDVIRPFAPGPDYPLSHAQQRIWLDQQVGGAANYNMPEAIGFAGRLDVDTLTRVLVAIVARHEILRTGIVVINGEPRQVVVDRLDLTIDEIYLSAAEEPETRSRIILDKEAAAPFDLTVPPLFRVTVLHHPDGSDILIIVLHHIIGDGWSRNLLHHELTTLYRAYRAGQGDPLPPLEVQYRDYAVWEAGRDFARDEEYWRTKLVDAPPHIALPHEGQQSAAARFKGDRRDLVIEPATAVRLRDLAVRRATSLSNVLLTLLNVLLFRISGQDDICLGMAVANRSHARIEPLIGCFVNVVPIRARLSRDMEFEELLAEVTACVGQALDHQSYPYDLLVRHLNRGDGSASRPFLDVIYAFQVEAIKPADVASKETLYDDRPTVPIDFAFAFAKAELCLSVVDHGERGLRLVLEYDVGLFRPTTIDRYLGIIDRLAKSLEGAQA